MIGKSVCESQLVESLRALGLSRGDVINAKVSLSAIGFVEGGAHTLLRAIRTVIGSSGTLVVDAFVKCYKLPLSPANAEQISSAASRPYTGAFARAVVECEDSHRAAHPILRYAVVGNKSRWLADSYGPSSEPYGMSANLIAMQGKHLKIGDTEKVPDVGTTHLAIERLGLPNKYPIPQLGVNYVDESGVVQLFRRNWRGGCAQGFNNLMPLYKESGAILSEGFIGSAPALLSSMEETFRVDCEAIKENPRIILCRRKACFRCRRFWEFSDTGLVTYLKNYVLSKF